MVMELRYQVSNYTSADPIAAFAWLDHAVKFAQALELVDYLIYDTDTNIYIDTKQFAPAQEADHA